jgi:hypothetical protein
MALTDRQARKIDRSMPTAKRTSMGTNLRETQQDLDGLQAAHDGLESVVLEVPEALIATQTKFNALLAKLDGDTGVTDDDYEAGLAVEVLADPADTRAALIATQEAFNALLAKLDADAGVDDANYAATLAVDVLGEE